MTSPSARFSAARVRSGASARAGISPEPQIGAPAQATMRRRGSAGSTMKPSASAAAVTVAAAADDRPITRSARPGAGRTPDAPACRAASTKREQVGGVGMAERQADAERKVMDADQLGGGTRGRRRPIDETIGDDGLECVRCRRAPIHRACGSRGAIAANFSSSRCTQSAALLARHGAERRRRERNMDGVVIEAAQRDVGGKIEIDGDRQPWPTDRAPAMRAASA